MKKHSISKIFLLFPSLVLTSCGYGLKEVYEGIPYNSTEFTENYYRVWDKSIDYRQEQNKITKTLETRILEQEKDKVFVKPFAGEGFETDYENFKICEKNWSGYEYGLDKREPDNGKKAYGPAVKLSAIDQSFNYGVASKLFDGQIFCNGDYQLSRTQVGSTNLGDFGGFGVRFAKECTYSEYFMCNFKCSYVTNESQNLGLCSSSFTLKLSFYLKNDNGFTRVPVEYDIVNAPTNSGDGDRYNGYMCFGFKLHQENDDALLDLNRLAGISFEYELKQINYGGAPVDLHPDNLTVYHSIMLYEISLPYSTWH